MSVFLTNANGYGIGIVTKYRSAITVELKHCCSKIGRGHIRDVCNFSFNIHFNDS